MPSTGSIHTSRCEVNDSTIDVCQSPSHSEHPFGTSSCPPVTVMGRLACLVCSVPSAPKRLRPDADKMSLPGLCNRLVVNRNPSLPTALELVGSRPTDRRFELCPSARTLVRAPRQRLRRRRRLATGASSTSSGRVVGTTPPAVTSTTRSTPLEGSPPFGACIPPTSSSPVAGPSDPTTDAPCRPASLHRLRLRSTAPELFLRGAPTPRPPNPERLPPMSPVRRPPLARVPTCQAATGAST